MRVLIHSFFLTALSLSAVHKQANLDLPESLIHSKELSIRNEYGGILQQILPHAIDFSELKSNGGFFCANNEKLPYSGWVKSNLHGKTWLLSYFKGGKIMSSIAWKPNGQKCLFTHVKNGNGSWIEYTPDGFEIYQISIKDGKPDKKLRVNGQFTRHPTWNDFTQNLTITKRWSEEKISLDKFDDKFVGFYFSASWCGPCKSFNKVLNKFYNENYEHFEFVLMSLDGGSIRAKYFGETKLRYIHEFNKNDSRKFLKLHTKLGAMPSLVVFSPGRKFITDRAQVFMRSRPDYFKDWMLEYKEGEKNFLLKHSNHNF